ncbi:MAG: alpha/beta hydrolase [Deltaproteobacteria bacterium]|nr:alpha/beta hydrolase [Deltaproteobacteria bacterium]
MSAEVSSAGQLSPSGFVPAFRLVGANDAPRLAFILHGILGTGRNWQGFAEKWVRTHPSFRVALVDLRGHGGSLGATGPHTLARCADDLDALVSVLGAPEFIIGHSFGSKVALTFAARKPVGIKSIWLVDAPPGQKSQQRRFEIERLIDAIERVPRPIESRESAVSSLAAQGVPDFVARWVATSLGGPAGRLELRLETAVIRELLADYFAQDRWDVVEDPQREVQLTFVRGTRSDRIEGENLERVRRLAAEGRVRLVELDAGHWVNSDDPSGLFRALEQELGRA